MPMIADAAFDAALSYVITNGTRLDLCSAEPGTYGALAGVTLGNKTGVTVGAAGNRSGGGREVVVPATTGGSVTATGTATAWALSDGASILVATGVLDPSLGVTSGNDFTTPAFAIGIVDAVTA